MLVSIVILILCLPPFPMETVASGLSITVETNKTKYLPSQILIVSGYVRLDGTPLEDVIVNVTVKAPSGETVWSTEEITDKDGFYSFSELLPSEAPTGTYNVTVEASYITGYGAPLYAENSVTFEVAALTYEEVKIGVYDPAETPIVNATVILYDHLSGEWVEDAKTNESGLAVMNVSTAIKFDVLIYKTGYGKIENGKTIGFYFDSNSTGGYSAPCSVNFTLQSGIDSGSLSGVVSDAVNSSAVNGATVSISAYIQGKTYVVQSTTTSSSGNYNVDLNVGTWRVWIDKKVNGETVYLGTWSNVQITAGASTTLNMALWPKAKLTIKSLTTTDSQELEEVVIMLINDTYGGLIWQANFLTIDLPKDFDVPAVNSLAVLLSKSFDGLYLGSVEVSLQGGGNASISSVLYKPEYIIWCFPSDWEQDRLLGNLTLETFVVTPETAEPGGPEGGPPQFMDPEGSISQYIMLDLGSEIPTTWRSRTTPIRTEVGSYFGFFDLDNLGAPEGYYIIVTLIRNSTGNAVAASFDFSNRFQYQIQPIQAKGIYDVGEDVEVKFKVYGSSGYVSNVEVSYKLFDDQWNFIEGGFATVDSTTKVWNVTLPSSIFSQEKYHLSIKISGGKEYTFDFRVQDYTPVTFSGQILPNASIDLFSPEHGTFVVTADQTGFFSIKIYPGEYDAWFHYDNKDTPGWDARDTGMRLTITSDITDFPNGFYDYWPMQPTFEVRGVAFNDTNNNGVWDSGEDRLALVNVRGINITGHEEWVPPTFPDGTYRLFLKPGAIYKLRATKTVYMQNETATPEIGEGTSQGDLLIVNIPMVKVSPGYVTGYVKLDNGTLLENVGLHFVDEYWSWIGSTFTNSTGGYLFTAPANKKMNIWVDPMGRPGIQGREVRNIKISEGETLILNITLYRSARINGTIQLNGMDVWAQILPLDKDWNRVWWDWGETGYFEADLPLSVRRLMIWTWDGGFLIKDVSLAPDETSNLGILDLTPTDPELMVDAHPKDWEWEWSVGQYVNFTVELRDGAMDWEPITGANITYWAWYWDTGELAGHGTVKETDPTVSPGIYEGSFLANKAGHYRVFILANVTASPSRINFNDFWISATDKKMYLIESRGEYSVADIQSGNAKILVKLLNASDGSPISGFDVWYEIRGFIDISTWEMETVVTRTPAVDLGNGVYKITLPKILDEGEYWMDITAGDWEASEHVGFYVAEKPMPTVNIYGYVTRSPAPVEEAIIETWMEGMPYLYVTTTNASGYYSLPVPEKHAYHMHIYYDNATTTGIDYTTMPEWERIEVKVLDVYHNASLAKVEDVSLTIIDEMGNPVDAEILIWDVSKTPYTLTLWAGTWRGPGLFKEKIAEGTYIFEIRSGWGWPRPSFWTDPKTVTTGPPPESFDVTVPTYDIVTEVWADTGGVWRAKPSANLTIMIHESDLGMYGLNAEYLLNNCEKRFEVFNWIPGKMGRGFAYNVTWVLKEKDGEKYLATNFTIPSYIVGGDVEIQIAFYNYSDTAPQKVFVLAMNHLLITPLDIGLTVVPFSASVGDTIMAVAVVMSEGAPATGVEVAFEIYNETWNLVDTLQGEEIAPGVYSVTFAVPEGYGEGWWTIKAIATVAGKEATAYEGFNVSPG